MNSKIKIKDVMNNKFIKLAPELVGGEAVQILYKNRKAYAPVVEDEKLEGWVNALDLLVGCKHSKVEDLMFFVDEIKILNKEDELTDDLINEMIKNEDMAHPVTNNNNEVVGTLSIFDILKYIHNINRG
ncbi:CBS domain-containing protein [Methanococcus aeolicus]|uniref:Signal transduction protein with CBS domains n=1 Tax=Methanococcus aeolicus (strain ATCC BAA-1280 / DSM 17508 / OCM 812 / Nankai-3) TaxID=419665 RepID=A6UTS0_META3|nr:CBS domain-containing protein [Methanococcus aeolicus]ABR55892.1 putative signal transduction protein with CBS domains [Methanococcus aeolicus Nankai-3]UXM84003.1 CBS domain-containing protein [Methanococcus aeolicus]